MLNFIKRKRDRSQRGNATINSMRRYRASKISSKISFMVKRS